MLFLISKNSLPPNCPRCRAPCPLAGRAFLAPRVSAANLPSPDRSRPWRENLPAQAPATCTPPAAPLSRWCSNGKEGSQRSPFQTPRRLPPIAPRFHVQRVLSLECAAPSLDSRIARKVKIFLPG